MKCISVEVLGHAGDTSPTVGANLPDLDGLQGLQGEVSQVRCSADSFVPPSHRVRTKTLGVLLPHELHSSGLEEACCEQPCATPPRLRSSPWPPPRCSSPGCVLHKSRHRRDHPCDGQRPRKPQPRGVVPLPSAQERSRNQTLPKTDGFDDATLLQGGTDDFADEALPIAKGARRGDSEDSLYEPRLEEAEDGVEGPREFAAKVVEEHQSARCELQAPPDMARLVLAMPLHTNKGDDILNALQQVYSSLRPSTFLCSVSTQTVVVNSSTGEVELGSTSVKFA